MADVDWDEVSGWADITDEQMTDEMLKRLEARHNEAANAYAEGKASGKASEEYWRGRSCAENSRADQNAGWSLLFAALSFILAIATAACVGRIWR